MKTLDLALGHPLFMQEYWDDVQSDSEDFTLKIEVNEGIAYGPAGGLPDLVDRIRILHEWIGNAETKNRHIVIGQGATQLLNAALSKSPFDDVYAKKPYFFRFPQIFKAQHLNELEQPSPDLRFTELVTIPSNPENEHYLESNAPWKVHDLCYNWPQYGNILRVDEPIMIYTLAKSTGHAGSKIGWAILKDKAMYDHICDRIEVSTGGVSTDAQLRAMNIIDSILTSGKNPFTAGQEILNKRWSRLKGIPQLRLKILNSSGMFAWCEIDGSPDAAKELELTYGIKGRPGVSCGGSVSHVRINMGCSQSDFEELITRFETRRVHVL